MPLASKPIGLILSVALYSFLWGCSAPQITPSKNHQSGSDSLSPEQEVNQLNIAVIPDRSPETQRKRLDKFDEYLEQELAVSVNFKVTEDYDTSIQLLVDEKVEMAYLGPFSYVKAKSQNDNIKPLVVHIESTTGRPWYTGVIVADTNQGIQTLEDLRGKRFGFVSQSSTSGYLVASVQFKAMGIDPTQDFAVVNYAGGHDKNAQALTNGEVDAIAIDRAAYLQAEASGDLPRNRYTIIWQSDPLPNAPLVISNKLPRKFQLNIQHALINAPEGLGLVGGNKASGYTSVQDKDYEPIRRIQQTLGLDNP